LKRFADFVHEFAQSCYGGVAPLLAAMLERTNYGAEWRGSTLETDVQRAANVDELQNAARQYDEQHADDPTLIGFLEETALVADVDALDDESGLVTLMTLHAAKGLEFPVAFIVAVEDGLLPHERATRDGSLNEIEEERRLLFVGMTRAEQRLFLTRAAIRTLHGKDYPSAPSRFLHEMQLGPENRTTTRETAYVPPLPEDPDETSPVSHARQRDQSRGSLPRLTTAADLLNGTKNSVEFPLTFSVGMSVRHPQLGLGQVVEAQGIGKWRTVSVVFHSGEPVSFVVHKCPLQPVGAG
jgi:DNA helicase-2/ATP-dependent DNA helicase PcrA